MLKCDKEMSLILKVNKGRFSLGKQVLRIEQVGRDSQKKGVFTPLFLLVLLGSGVPQLQ